MVVGVAVFCTACKSPIKGVGEVVPETRSLEGFSEIELNGLLSADFRQIKSSEVNKVVVKAQENLIPLIKSTVEDGLLVLEISESIHTERDIEVEIYGVNLRSITMNGSGDFKNDSRLKIDKLYLENNGSGNLNLNTNSQDVQVELNGSGDVNLEGNTDYLECELNGSGDINGAECRAFQSEVLLNGSGDISVFVKETLDVEINGSGDVYYKGKPKLTKELNGTGSLKEK